MVGAMPTRFSQIVYSTDVLVVENFSLIGGYSKPSLLWGSGVGGGVGVQGRGRSKDSSEPEKT